MFLIGSHLAHQNVPATHVHKLVKSFFKAGNHFWPWKVNCNPRRARFNLKPRVSRCEWALMWKNIIGSAAKYQDEGQHILLKQFLGQGELLGQAMGQCSFEILNMTYIVK